MTARTWIPTADIADKRATIEATDRGSNQLSFEKD